MNHIDTLVIGGGQAGLVTGYHLQRAGVPFAILDAEDRIGDAWRKRWDSLVLFTPGRLDGLDGMPFPGKGDRFVGKDEMADYLEQYATHFDLPVHLGVRVQSVTRDADGFVVRTSAGEWRAQRVIIAMGNYQKPRVPAFADQLDADIVQMHSTRYKNADQLPRGKVLVVGAGNSGADIAMDLAKHRETILAGREPGTMPVRIETWFGRNVAFRVLWFLGTHVLNLNTPLGRRVREGFIKNGTPLIRVKPWDMEPAGIERVGRIEGVRDGLPALANGETLDVDAVVWSTGLTSGFENWVHLDVFDDSGHVVHDRGVTAVPGLYFVGLEFQFSATSSVVAGVSRDAAWVVNRAA